GRAVEATVLYCDIRGFTGLAATLDPDALMTLLADYQSRVVACIAAHGGSVDKFLGDGVLASFGAARPSRRHAAAAVEAAIAIVAACDAWAREREAAGLHPVRIGVTVAAGTVVFGAVGDASRLEITVIGEPVNLAAK
ncbi:adenylate/guanylate cyclase domain-containing protein, partial [Enterococcus faecium]|uniref:adenylate/guanylate cyclase domain-containing protein n=1 Tax=Enterococcus faecium TaxID=1352 RepID=UPI003AAE2122